MCFYLIASAEPVLCPQKFLSSDFIFLLNERSGAFVSLEADGKIGKRSPVCMILSRKRVLFAFIFFKVIVSFLPEAPYLYSTIPSQVKEGTEHQIPQNFQGLKCDRVYSQCTPSLSNFLIQCLKRNSCNVARPQFSRNKRPFLHPSFLLCCYFD